jgi:prepilin-type N-terminal cleavage/methylation domain-containing protein
MDFVHKRVNIVIFAPTMNHKAFTLLETLIVIAIIGVLAAISFGVFTTVRQRAGDTRRKSELYQIGKMLSFNCFVPAARSGDYDLMPIILELKTAYPQYASSIPQIPRDPSLGTDTESFYRYIVDEPTKKCAVYANLRNASELVTLPTITVATPGGGTGVFAASVAGWNGTTKYFQVSN